MLVRKLIEEDAGAYWDLRLEAVEREPRSFGATPEEHRRITIPETVALILKPGSFLVGAFDGEVLAGIARFDREGYEKERHKGHVYGVYVTASHRGRGIAKALVGAIVEESQDDPSCEQLVLSVGVFNVGARAVYRAMGFVPYGIEPRALRAGEEYIDEEHMILFLKSAEKDAAMSIERRTMLKAMGAVVKMSALRDMSAEAQNAKTIFELRIYHTAEGRLPALLARFRDHTVDLFTKHGISSVAYWTPVEEPLKGRTLVYILKFPSREEAVKRWQAFQDDPEWVKVKAESEASGEIVQKIDSTFLEMTDFSPKLA